MSYVTKFKEQVDVFLSLTGVKPTVMGQEALHDGNFVSALRLGREPKPSTIEKVERWMAAYRVEHGFDEVAPESDREKPLVDEAAE